MNSGQCAVVDGSMWVIYNKQLYLTQFFDEKGCNTNISKIDLKE